MIYITQKRLDFIFLISDKRQISDKMRDALTYHLIRGHSIEAAAVLGEVNSDSLCRAASRINDIDNAAIATYGIQL